MKRGLCIAITVILVSRVTLAASPLKLTLSTEKSQLVVREPVKLSLELQNTSAVVVSVVDIGELNIDNEMENTLLEVQSPEGRVVYRRNAFINEIEMVNTEYIGEALPAGGIIHVNIYPNVTHEFDLSTGRFVAESKRLTFEYPGTYRVRVAYYVPDDYHHLFAGPNRVVMSNVVVFSVRDPSREETEILDAIWAGGAIQLSDFDRVLFDEDRLRDVIARYPDSDLVPYAEFALARSLAATVNVGRWTEAKDILQALITEHPGFRTEEVHVQLGYVAANLRDQALERSTMEELLKQQPVLQNNYRTMQAYLFAKSGGAGAVTEWVELRKQGKAPIVFPQQN